MSYWGEDKDRALWDLGGVTHSSAGTLERFIDGSRIGSPPVIELEGERLIWARSYGESGTIRDPAPGMLAEFVRLSDAPAQAILDYARRWGVLFICKHGVPASHNQAQPVFPGFPRHLGGCKPLGWSVTAVPGWTTTGPPNWHVAAEEPEVAHGWEPLERWRYFAGYARMILDVAVKLHRSEHVPFKTWSDYELWYWPGPGEEDGGVVTIGDIVEGIGLTWRWEDPRRHFAEHVNAWLRLGGVVPHLDWGYSVAEPRLSLRSPVGVLPPYGNLFGALAVQLMLAVARIDDLAFCHSCHLPYVPPRRPTPGRRSFCPACGKRAARRAAASDFRQRQRGANGASEP